MSEKEDMNLFLQLGIITGMLSKEVNRKTVIKAARETDFNIGYVEALRDYLDEIIKAAKP